MPELGNNSTPWTFAEFFRVGEVKGRVQNKAISLPKPSYPYEAISHDAAGNVIVEIAINDQGTVVSAKAIAGHESLWTICEQTAKLSKFRPFRVDGSAVQTVGEIVYQFDIIRADWLSIGYEVGSLSSKGSMRYFPTEAIGMAFDLGWSEELQILKSLKVLKQAQIKQYSFELPTDRPYLRNTTKKFEDGSLQTILRIELRPSNPTIPSREQIQTAEHLTSRLRDRLSSMQIELWRFNLGIELSTVFETRNDPQARARKAATLRAFLDNFPAGVEQTVIKGIEAVHVNLKEKNRSFDKDLNLYQAIVSTIVNGQGLQS